MGRIPLHALIWSEEQHLYELYIQGRLEQRFQPTDEVTWLPWLHRVSSFAFHGKDGSLNVYLEKRPRGGAYWYAYQTKESRTRKRYLGRTENLSLARLEETARALVSELKPAQALDQGSLVLASQLTPPRLPNALVGRERLLVALDGALATPLTLLAAPAGFGKTTLLATWASRHTAQVAWLSLSELDKSTTRFWVALIVALRRGVRSMPNFGDTAMALLQSPQPPPLSTILTTLLHELGSREIHPAPLVLMMDDYQVIEEQAIHEGITFWVEHLPAHLHLLLSSRVDPDLPLARWRVRGQLTEIRADELRFQEGEASSYLGHMLSPPLSEEEVRQLVNRTEGWIAGLQLAALTLQKRADRAAFLQTFTGSQRYLLDYVQEEILARLPERVRDFLLHTAILSHLDASVCQAVTEAPSRAASQQMLLFLERANLFLMPLDEERRWYRLHDLFREALLSALHTTHPELAPVLHSRAAAFYEAQEQWYEAIAHRLATADFSAAACLMEQTVEQFWLHGEAATMACWVMALPQPLVREHARLVLTTALYLLNTVDHTTQEQRKRRHTEVRQLMARVETALWRESDKLSPEIKVTRADAAEAFPPKDLETLAAEEALLQRRLHVLRVGLAWDEAFATQEYERLSVLQQEIQELDRDEEVTWQMLPLSWSFILHFTVRQEGARLLPQLLEAERRVSQSGSHFAVIRIRQWLAMAAVEAGHLHLAYEESQAALALIEQMEGFVLLKGYFEVVQIQVLYRWNRLEEARELLHTVVHDAAAWQQLDLLGIGYFYFMRVELAAGEFSAAQQALREAEQLVLHEQYGAHPILFPPMRVQLGLAQGQLREASDWAAGIAFPEGPWEFGFYEAFPVVIRVYFAQRHFREAASLLERWSGHLDRPTNIGITLTYLAQYLVALHQTGKRHRAHEIAARLFALTEPEGYLRVYLDEGEPMQEALSALLDGPYEMGSAISLSYLSALLQAFEHEEHKPMMRAEASLVRTEEAPVLSTQSVSSASSRSALSLSRQERRVLHLLVAGRTYTEMAKELIVSLNTVKTQVSSIYRKLGVSRRAEAIIEASRLHLL